MKSKITKKTTKFRLPISPEERLAITLQLLVTGETYKSLIYQYQVSKVPYQDLCQKYAKL